MRICSGRSISCTRPWAGGPADGDSAQRAGGQGAFHPGVQDDGVAQEFGGGAVGGAGVDHKRVADLGQLAAAHHGHLVGEGQRLGLVVGDQDGGDAGVVQDLGHGPAGGHPQAGVQGGERLVQQHQFGFTGQGAGQGHTLLLAAGELVRPPLGHGGVQGDHLQQFADPGRHRRGARRGAWPASRPKAMFWPTVRCGKRAPSWAT